MMTFLHESLIQNGYTLSSDTEQKMAAYLELMHRWNRVFNLTAIKDPNESVLLHILDSLSICDDLHGHRILDVGTGAGLPGIPLALMCPDKEFVLLDSNSKKTRFLNQVIYELNIKNVTVVHARCEDFQPKTGFDSIVSRAFASIQVMLDVTQHLVCEDGQFLAMKGVYPDAEINAIPAKFTLLHVKKLKIIGLDAERHLISVKKAAKELSGG